MTVETRVLDVVLVIDIDPNDTLKMVRCRVQQFKPSSYLQLCLKTGKNNERGSNMSDPWVLGVQTYLNTTYSSHPGWVTVKETGKTGWSTMYALTRALQIELGFDELSENFGPGTFAAVDNIAPIGELFDETPTVTEQRINNIIRGGLYCKGYDGGSGDLDGYYIPTTTAAVKELRMDMGLAASTGKVTPKVFKALLTMDAYVLLDDGSSAIRSIQQSLNARYVTREDFYVIPADGYYSRAVQNALMLALQYEIGMDDGVANGNFGNGTQAGIREQAHLVQGSVDTTKYFVHLFQAALTFNGYATTIGSTYTAATKAVVSSFQSFCKLPVTGEADFTTWASLLVSTGDPTRSGKAADCITTITATHADTLVANGFETVGRYLTNYPGPNPTNKKIQPGELDTIFAHGLTVFPIFQEGGDELFYFTYGKGLYAGATADAAAREYGFKPGTVIYFAADFDALEEEVESNVVPFFRGVRDALAQRNSTYSVGVYGSRNTCAIVSENGLAELSFVSGMSTGYSGNLGYPLPSNWAFDQVLEYSISSGGNSLNIDKDIKSGRDLGQSSVLPLPVPPVRSVPLVTSLMWLEDRARAFRMTHPDALSVAELVSQYLQAPTYLGIKWSVLAGVSDPAWLEYAHHAAIAENFVVIKEYEPYFGAETADASHLFATLSTLLFRGLPALPDNVGIVDIGGWGGDLITTLRDYIPHRTPGESMKDFGKRAIGAGRWDAAYTFGEEDLSQDADAFNVASCYLADPTRPLSHYIREVLYGGIVGGENRYETFRRLRFGTQENTTRAAYRVFLDAFPQPDSDRIVFNTALTYLLFIQEGPSPVLVSDFTTAQIQELAEAFAEVLWEK